MAFQRAAGRPRGPARDRAGRPRRPPRRPAARADGQLPGGADHLHRGVARRGGGHAADLPGQRGRAEARAEQLRRGRHRHHGGVPAEGHRRCEGGWPGGTGGGSPPGAEGAGGAPGVRFALVPGAQASSVAPGVPVLDFDQVASAEPGPIVGRSGTDLAALRYTGGTTGRSKGVPLTHAGLYWCGSAVHEMSGRDNVISSVLPLPLAHAYGLLVICAGMHRTDQPKTILMRWFDPAGWVKLAEEHRVQFSALVPSMIQMLLTQPLEKADLSELTRISSAAAPLAEEVRREFEARVPTATVYEGYGCTEAAILISANPRDARRIGSVGLPAPGVEVTIQDDAGQVLP